MTASTILVATDFSEMSRQALEHAAANAKLTGAKILIVHALAVPSPDQGEGMLHSGVEHEDPQIVERRLKAVKPSLEGVRVEHRLLRGAPAKEILKLADDENVDLIVMGTHGRTGVLRALMGSVTEEVVRNATCPVVTVKVPKAGT